MSALWQVQLHVSTATAHRERWFSDINSSYLRYDKNLNDHFIAN